MAFVLDLTSDDWHDWRLDGAMLVKEHPFHITFNASETVYSLELVVSELPGGKFRALARGTASTNMLRDSKDIAWIEVNGARDTLAQALRELIEMIDSIIESNGTLATLD